MTTIKKKNRYRRADNGEYTTRKFAERHPSTTVKETDKQSTRHKRKRYWSLPRFLPAIQRGVLF